MVPLLVSRHDTAGGAARAALRLGTALNAAGVEAALLCSAKTSDLDWVLGRKSFAGTLHAMVRSHAGAMLLRRQKGMEAAPRSANRLPSRLDRIIAALPHDVVNLHWVGGEFLSVEAIGRIEKPVVWTMHDMWPFAGAEHYAADDAGARWRHGYARDNRASGARGPDLDRLTWLRKQRAWRRPRHVVCPSRWLADCVRGSALMRDWPVEVIPNPLDLAVFRPWPKALAREMLGLPADVPLLAFGAMGGTRDPRKGWDLLQDALAIVAAAKTGAEAVIFGQSRPRAEPDLPLRLHWTGHLSDDIALALLYSAVDLVVVPSRQDNLPQTATEPQACGCPVVAFDTAGLPDALEAGVTGLLAKPFDAEELAAHMVTLLADPGLRTRQSIAARARAERLWDPVTLVAAYRRVYSAALSAG